MLPSGTYFACLKRLLDDFVGHNIEAAAALVEGAGRFMIRCPETKVGARAHACMRGRACVCGGGGVPGISDCLCRMDRAGACCGTHLQNIGRM